MEVLVVVAGSDDNVRHRRRVEDRVREGHVVQHRRHRHLTMQRDTVEVVMMLLLLLLLVVIER